MGFDVIISFENGMKCCRKTKEKRCERYFCTIVKVNISRPKISTRRFDVSSSPINSVPIVTVLIANWEL